MNALEHLVGFRCRGWHEHENDLTRHLVYVNNLGSSYPACATIGFEDASPLLRGYTHVADPNDTRGRCEYCLEVGEHAKLTSADFQHKIHVAALLHRRGDRIVALDYAIPDLPDVSAVGIEGQKREWAIAAAENLEALLLMYRPYTWPEIPVGMSVVAFSLFARRYMPDPKTAKTFRVHVLEARPLSDARCDWNIPAIAHTANHPDVVTNDGPAHVERMIAALTAIAVQDYLRDPAIADPHAYVVNLAVNALGAEYE